MKYIEVENYAEMSKKGAALIAAEVVSKPNAVLGLATGSTPVGIYKQLIEWFRNGDLDFSGVTSVNLDEYLGLDGTNPQSYRYFMNDNLFNHVNIDKSRTFVPSGTADDLAAEGEAYDKLIKSLGGIDIQLLGIGEDGHIGFNEPDDCFTGPTHVVDLDESTVVANARFFDSIDDVPRKAITMGMASIMQAKKVLLVANGPKKYDIIQKAFFGPITPKVPASILQLHGDLTVIYSKI